MVIPVKPINEIEVKSEVSVNDKILICDSETEEARLASKDELKGDKGDKGDTGETWPQWPQGIQWPKWDKWDKGDKWAKGDKGDKWDKGDKGDKWDTWATWPQGATWPQWPQGVQWIQWETWDAFAIYKTYASISAMNADKANVPEWKFVMITSTVEDPDNSKLYVKGASDFSFVTDMSWATGIQGEQWPQWIQWEQGIQWQDWLSPSATVTQSWGITTISITDAQWTTTESIDMTDYVTWPDSSLDENIAIFDWENGQVIQDSWVKLSDKQDKLTAWTDLEIVTTPSTTQTITWTDSLVLNTAKENSLTNLTQSWVIEQWNLPYTYKQVTYIRNGANSKADTWFKPTVDDIELDIRFLAKTGSYYIWQSRDGGGWNILWLWWAQSGSTITLYGWGGSVTSNISRIADNIYHVNGKLKNWVATLYVKNEDTWDEDTQTGTYTFTANNTNFYFFWNSANTLSNWNRIYSAVLKYQWEIIANYIPAVSSANSSVIWFYNKIDGSFIWPEEWSWVFVAWDNVTAPLNTAPLDIHCNNWVLKYNNWVISVSWTAETLSLTGINLLSSSITYADDKFINASWVESDNVGMCASSLIPVIPNKNYTRSAISWDSRWRRIHQYDSEWNWISQLKSFTPSEWGYSSTVTTGANTRYIRVSTSMTETNRMLEIWDTAHDYEAYTNLWTATVENLFKLGNHADTHEIISWAVNRKLRVIALNWTETYSSGKAWSTFRYTLRTPTPPLIEYSSQRWIILSTHFKSIHTSTVQTPWWVFVHATNNGTIYFIPEDQTIDTVDKFSAWVKNQYDNGTPVIVIYVQSTATTSSVAWQPLSLREWDNTISVKSAEVYWLPLSATYTTHDVNTINFTNDSWYVTSAEVPVYTAWTGISIDEDNVISATGGGGNGDVVWPNSATNWNLAVFDWTTGKLIKDWGAVPVVPTVVDNLTTQSATSTLSANQWYVLKWLIDDLMGQGRFLSLWNCATWMPISFPLSTPYTYLTGDYFMVETLDTVWEPPVNYRPTGSSYSGTASSTAETWEVAVWDYYVYDWTVWLLASNHWKNVSFSNLAWQPSDNANLSTALNGKQNNRIEVTVTTAYNTAAKVWTTTAGNYTPTKWDFLLVNFVNGCSVNSPTLNIDGSWAINIKLGWADAGTEAFHLWSSSNVNVKVLMYYDWDYYKVWSVRNTAYYAMSVEEWQTGTATTQRTMRADNLKQIIKYQAVNDTAYWSGWDWVTDTAPSKNAVYDKIESVVSSIPTVPTNVSSFTNDAGYITSSDITWKQDKATSWSTAPSTTPTYVWQQYVDTTNDKLYVATGTSSSSDWVEVWSGGWWWDTPAVVFALEDTSDTIWAQDIIDFLWEDASYYVVISFWEDFWYYVLCEVSSTYADFLRVDIDWDKQYKIRINYNSGTHIVSTITAWYNTIWSVVSGDSGTTYTLKVSNSAPASWTPNTTITFVV